MESFYLALSVVFPLFFMMAAGYIVKRVRMADDRSFNVMNTLVFRLFLPILLFLNVYHLEPASIFTSDNMKMLVITVGFIFITLFAFGWILKRSSFPEKEYPILLQGIYRSNLALFGLPVIQSVYGEANSGSIYILIVFVIPIYNILAVILLEEIKAKEIGMLDLLKKIFKNPLVDSSLLGAVFCFAGIRLPEILLDSLDRMADVATPLAFVVLGGTLEISSFRKNSKEILYVSFLRLILVPAAVVGTGILAGLRDVPLVAMLACAASPIAVSSFSMAKEMNKEPELAGELVAATSVLSLPTIFGWIVILRSFGLIAG